MYLIIYFIGSLIRRDEYLQTLCPVRSDIQGEMCLSAAISIREILTDKGCV